MYYLIESAPDKDRVVAKSHSHDEIIQEYLDALARRSKTLVTSDICDYYIAKRVIKC